MAAVTEIELAKLLSTAETSCKAADGGDGAEEQHALGALRVLQGTVVTVELLQRTDAGRRVKKLCKTSSAKIASAATAVVDAWKECVKKQKPAGAATDASRSDSSAFASTSAPDALLGSSSGAGQTAAVAAGLVSTASLQAKAPVSGSSAAPSPASVPPAAAVVRQPSMPPADLVAPKTGDETRDRIRALFVQTLWAGMQEAGADAPEAYADPCALAAELEDAMCLQNGGVNAKYKAKYRSLAFNLKDATNPDLRARVLRGELKGNVLVNLTAEQLASDTRRQANDRIRDDMKKECERGQSSAASTDMFQCGRCKQRKCTYYQLQTRSADEPMTTFVTCTVCGKRWKFC